MTKRDPFPPAHASFGAATKNQLGTSLAAEEKPPLGFTELAPGICTPKAARTADARRAAAASSFSTLSAGATLPAFAGAASTPDEGLPSAAQPATASAAAPTVAQAPAQAQTLVNGAVKQHLPQVVPAGLPLPPAPAVPPACCTGLPVHSMRTLVCG